LVEECFDKKTGKFETRFDCRVDFTRGDNNDGIMIIDATTKKYCFIREIYTDVIKPVSASVYVRGYRPTSISKLGSYEKERCGKDATKIQELLEEHKDICNFVKEQFKVFKVLSLNEVKELFPAMFQSKEVKEEVVLRGDNC
jgi:hypothetical protein